MALQVQDETGTLPVINIQVRTPEGDPIPGATVFSVMTGKLVSNSDGRVTSAVATTYMPIVFYANAPGFSTNITTIMSGGYGSSKNEVITLQRSAFGTIQDTSDDLMEEATDIATSLSEQWAKVTETLGTYGVILLIVIVVLIVLRWKAKV